MSDHTIVIILVMKLFFCSFSVYSCHLFLISSASLGPYLFYPSSSLSLHEMKDLLELTPKKDVLFIIGDWNEKEGSQQTPGVTRKFGLGVQSEPGQRLTVLPRECTGHSKHPLPKTQEKTLHMDITRWVNTEIRLIILTRGYALY